MVNERSEQELDRDEGARAEDAARRCRACDECHSRREDVSSGAPSWENVPVLTSPSELESYPRLQTSDEQHIADPDGILARYEFSTEVACSLKGRHRHQIGVVVRTLCDLVICMGRRCGKKSIVGFEDVHRSVARRVRFQGDVAYLDGWTDRFERRIRELERPLATRDELLLTLTKHLPELAAELRRRCDEGARGAEVRVASRDRSGRVPEELRAGTGDQVLRLSGLSLFRKVPRLARLRSALVAFREQERLAPPLDGGSARELKAMARSADRRADEAAAWVRETTAFLSEANLRLALAALGRDNPVVRAEGHGWRVGYFPGRSALLELPDASPKA